MPLYFSLRYFLLTIILLLTEIAIALFIKDTFVRPFIGDCLVVILIYCFVRTFLNINYWKAAFGVFVFACAIEVLQYFDYVKLLGLEQNRILSVALGRTFEWLDFAAYFTGFLLIIIAERVFLRSNKN